MTDRQPVELEARVARLETLSIAETKLVLGELAPTAADPDPGLLRLILRGRMRRNGQEKAR